MGIIVSIAASIKLYVLLKLPFLSIKDKSKNWPNLKSILCKGNFLYSIFEVTPRIESFIDMTPLLQSFHFSPVVNLICILLIFVKLSYITDKNNRIFSI